MVSSRSYKNTKHCWFRDGSDGISQEQLKCISLIKFLILVALAMSPGSSQPTPVTQLVQGYGALTQKAESQF